MKPEGDAHMPRKKPSQRSKRTREHVIADLSVNHAERQALLCGYSVQRREPDYGLDLLVTTYNPAGEIENGHISFQLKATDSLEVVSGGRVIAVRVEAKHFRHWLLEPMPVILVHYDAQADAAYWLYIQAYFESEQGRNLDDTDGVLTVHVPRANVLDLDAMRKFAGYRDRLLEQMKGFRHHE